ncbi:MAG: hypothetical protein IJL00_05120 [Clostridia bacterium]|nr:hypothetical protein [Clostridia bacterium]
MDKFRDLITSILNFLFQMFKDLKIFGEDSKMPDVLMQYYQDANTVIDAARG